MSIGSHADDALMWFGARLTGAGRATFRLWAPDADGIAIAIDGGAPMPMRRIGDGFLEADAPARAGTRYHYVLEDGTRVPDPAARAAYDALFDRYLRLYEGTADIVHELAELQRGH